MNSSPDIMVHPTAKVRETAIVGLEYRPLQTGSLPTFGATELGRDVFVGHHAKIGQGSKLHDGVIIDDDCKVECGVVIGAGSIVQYRSQICNLVQIGSKCVIGAFVTERTYIGDRCRIFGNIVHRHRSMDLSWDSDEAAEPSAEIHEDVFVGVGAIIIGAITIGRGCYIAANAVVSRSVPANRKVVGNNQILER